MEEKGISLFHLSKQIQEALRNTLERQYWIKAEIAQIKENYSGHCYLELIEKDTKSDKLIAQAKATIWGNTYRILKPYFKTTAGRELTVGLTILVAVRVEFHELYGLSLNITDIDPSYTVGDLALKKAAIIKQLQDEGVFDMNKELEMPLVLQRIAVISSDTAAGYTDFISHLEENPYGYHIHTQLFAATMQGAKAEESIIDALDAIFSEVECYDAIAIIRGGGSQTDLSCFDSYILACNVAQMPIPVITGIGHEQDDSITDMVAHTRLKTPTAVAAFIIEAIASFENQIEELQHEMIELTRMHIDDHRNMLQNIVKNLPLIAKEIIFTEHTLINHLKHSVSKIATRIVNKELFAHKSLLRRYQFVLQKKYIASEAELNSHRLYYNRLIFNKLQLERLKLNTYSNTTNLINPENILKKGFSITTHKGKPVTNASQVNAGETIETMLYNGILQSIVKESDE